MPFLVADQDLVVLVTDDAGIVAWKTHTRWDIVTATTTFRPGDNLQRFLAQA